MAKELILVRHAHRDVSLRSLDNGLSEKGRDQALTIASDIIAKIGKGRTPLILSSAKVRCVETVTPLATELGLEVVIDPLLMEQLPGESDSVFLGRINQFVENWKTGNNDLVISCSHGDLLPILIEKLTGSQRDLFKGEWVAIQI